MKSYRIALTPPDLPRLDGKPRPDPFIIIRKVTAAHTTGTHTEYHGPDGKLIATIPNCLIRSVTEVAS